LSAAAYGAETWTLRNVDQKYLESFKMWCWKRMEKISWTDRVRNEKKITYSKGGKKYASISLTKTKQKGRKTNWNGHILRTNRLLKHVIEGRIDGTMEVREDKNKDVKSY
jgi:hypothetical protein